MPPEPPPLSVRTTHADGASTIVLSGEIDLYNSTRVNREFEDVLERTPAPAVVLVDLSGVTFMDTTGLAVLLKAHRRGHAVGSRVTISAASKVIERLLVMSGLNGLLTGSAD